MSTRPLKCTCTWSDVFDGIKWFLGLKLSKEEEAHWKCVRLGLGQKDEEPVVEADGSGGEGCTDVLKQKKKPYDKCKLRELMAQCRQLRETATAAAHIVESDCGTSEAGVHGEGSPASREEAGVHGEGSPAGREEAGVHGEGSPAGREEAGVHGEGSPASREEADTGFNVKHNMLMLLLKPRALCKMEPDEKLSNLEDILNCRCYKGCKDCFGTADTKKADLYWIEQILNLQYSSEIFVDDSSLYMHEVTQKRPYFTIWLMLAHIIILVATVATYNFAPYQWGVTTKVAFVQRSSLALEVARKNMTGSVWGGPDLESLVLLGAIYAPCMRRDRQLYTAIEADRKSEADQSGCCIRRDKSGCYQAPSSSVCPATYADFVYQYNNTVTNTSVRAVCGTSPYTCIEPNKVLNPSWNSASISDWPICSQAVNVSTPSYLSCELTGRPCCVGLQAKCLLTTLEHCSFLGGHYHSEAFLCSQVDCLSAVCGLLPFTAKDNPDQWYRLGLSLFIHAGVLHLILTLLFDVFILWVIELKLGWLRTSFVYIFSGIGGNIISAIFVPYYPQVGPGASIFGIVANIFVFVGSEYPYWKKRRRALPILCCVLGIFFVLGILFPFLDNWAHFGGFLFGFVLSWIVIQMKPFEEDEVEGRQIKLTDKYKKEFVDFYTKRNCCKRGMTVVSMVILPVLFAVCLAWFYAGQENLYGFIYLNCVPYTSSFCLDYGLELESRNLY